ncbi:MAG: hypothetical protein ACKO97_06955 [Actinomycetota bacterium]
MKPLRDATEVAATLERWAKADAQAGERAAQRRAATLQTQGERDLHDYEFRKAPNDWIHLDWVRPIRFIYRNLPFRLRMTLKKRMAR